MSLKKYFSTLFYENQLPLPLSRTLLPQLLKESYIFCELDTVGLEWSDENYPSGYTSYSSSLDLPNQSPYFADLKKWLDREVKKFAKKLEIDFEQGHLELSSLWINIMGPNCQHPSHLHPLSTISGTFYLKFPKKSGIFRIEDPRLSQFMGSAPRKPSTNDTNKRFIDIVPAAAKLILFESWLRHEVKVNQSKDERVSISFNYDWKW